MKKVINFRFNNEQFAAVAEYLQKMTVGTPFYGHVYLNGDGITNQVLGIKRKSEYLNIIIDVPNGGLTFPIWLAYKNKNYVEGQNPLLDTDHYCGVVNIGEDDPKLKNIFMLCQQTRNSFLFNEARSHEKWFGTLEEDANKRGFTFESLYYNVADECLYDVTEKAFDDIEHGIIRATDPSLVFKENPIKVLSAIRCATDYGFGISKETWFAMLENAKYLVAIKQFSIRAELDKIILTQKPSEAIMRILKCGCAKYTWPFLEDMARIRTMPYDHVNETLLIHTLKVVDNVPPFLITRIGALLHDIGKIDTASSFFVYHQYAGADKAEEIMLNMGYSTVTTSAVKTVVEHHEDLSKFRGSMTPGTKFAKKMATQCGPELKSVLDVIDANNKAQVFGKKVMQVKNFLKVLEKLKEDEEAKKLRMKAKVKLPIDGNDIKKEFKLKTGIKIGQLLTLVKKEYEKNSKLTRDECFSLCENALSKGL